LRTPELLKAITGSTLKGTTDPILDKLNDDEKAKLAHLDSLERKGFDVTNLKEAIISKTNNNDQELYNM
jgi:hypothetical protein